MKNIYLIGSLRNPNVPILGNRLREMGWDVFDDWYAAGPEADDYWQKYEEFRGHSIKHALNGYAAQHVYEFDRYHLDKADIGVLLLPAGKSGHLELGYLVGRQKLTYVVFPEPPERFDVMYNLVSQVCLSAEELFNYIGVRT